MITYHVKWVKTCVNKEESTYDCNVVNDEELITVPSSEKSIATCCIVHLACCKKYDDDKLDKTSEKTQKLCMPWISIRKSSIDPNGVGTRAERHFNENDMISVLLVSK